MKPHTHLLPPPDARILLLRRLILFISLFLSPHHHIALVRGDAGCPVYTPTEKIAINCGSSDTSHTYLNWTGDAAPLHKLFTLHDSTASVKANLPPTAPYASARLSRRPFSYTVPATAGQKFLRLHFYPASYPGDSDAFFSVTANGFTLLQNFGASLAADQVVHKEFCLNVDGAERSINVTFTPSGHDSYAFINAIELVSMPNGLYYKPEGQGDPAGVGIQGMPVTNTTALETMYRLNVGGKRVSQGDDTGMYRIWEGDDDYAAEAGVSPVNRTSELIRKNDICYAAPEKVYRSARSMGVDNSANSGYNLTWKLPVDGGFFYLVRLHFCELEPMIQKPGDREFRIYIANQIAEEQADVIDWSGGNSIPVYRDYEVFMEKSGIANRINLSVALLPNDKSRTHHIDAILNGLELLKLSNATGSLAAPNPPPSLSREPPAVAKSGKPGDQSNKRVILVAVPVSVSLLVMAGACMCIRSFSVRKPGRKGAGMLSSRRGPAGSFTRLPSVLCRDFSLSEITSGTNNFDDARIIGRGGFGIVYRGFVDGGVAVAIKRLKAGSKQGAREFMTEIRMLSQLRHLHLVSLIGYCDAGGEMVLVYDYMSRGTLRDHLYNTDNSPLSWEKRLRICIGAARGLQYLHSGAKQTVIHRDVKSTNILLDENWVAKVSDFGLSKVQPTNLPNAHISTIVKGSFGYMDPEYFRRQQLTEKSDVYSFGVVLMEALCARPALNQDLPKEQVSLAEWARRRHREGTMDGIVDPVVEGQIAEECLKVYGEVAVSCLRDEGVSRPSMEDVAGILEFALQLQESSGKGTGVRNPVCDRDSSHREGRSGSSGGQGSSVNTSTETGFEESPLAGDAGAVFSEIANPDAR